MDNSSKLANNRITSVRLFCAVMVLFSHLDWIAGNSTDSFRRLGIYAVAIFFGLSGFLLTDTIVRNGATSLFIRNRLLRIFPGLIGVLFTTSFLFAPVYQMIEAREVSFFFTSDNIFYILRNFTTYSLQADINGALANTNVQIWNPPLWTLTYELLCYFSLFALFRILGKRFKTFILFGTPIFLSSYLLLRLFGVPMQDKVNLLFYYSSFFFLGSLLFYSKRLLDFRFAVFLLPFLSIACLIPRESNSSYFDNRDLFLGIILIPITLIFCFTPRVKKRLVNDYSFGIYIYAAPITQLLVLSFPNIGDFWIFFAFCTLVLTFIFAWLSWNFIESPALRLKEKMYMRKNLREL